MLLSDIILILIYFTAISQYLPMSLATKKLSERYKKQKARAPIADAVAQVAEKVGADEDVVDLFNRDRMYLTYVPFHLTQYSYGLISGLRSVLRRRLKLTSNKKDKKKDKQKKAEENEHLSKVEEAPTQATSSATRLVGEQPGASNGSANAGPSVDPSAPAPGPAAKEDPHVQKRPASRGSLRSVSTSSSKAAGQAAGQREAIAEEKVKEAKKDDEAVFPKIAPPAEALRAEDEDEDGDEFFEEHAFDHPSTCVYLASPISRADGQTDNILIDTLTRFGSGCPKTPWASAKLSSTISRTEESRPVTLGRRWTRRVL